MVVLGPYHALSHAFTVACADPVVSGQVARVLSSLVRRRTGSLEGAAMRYVLVLPSDTGGGLLTCEGDVLLRSRNVWLLYTRLLWHINKLATEATSECTLLHAGAAEVDGRAVLLPAPMESGKTTLVAGLVRSGMAYLTDETVALRPDDRRIVPYPKALSVDDGAWTVLSDLEPPLPAEATHLVGAQWQVPPDHIRPGAVSPGARPALLLIPRYEAGARLELTRLTPGQALLATLPQVFHLPRNRSRDLEVLAGVLAEVPAYSLVSGELGDAVAGVRGLLNA